MDSDADGTPTAIRPAARIANLVVRASTIQSIASRPRGVTTDMYVPVLLVTRVEAFRRPIDDRARFLLGFIDDRTQVFELLEASGMPLSDGVDALIALYDAGLVGLAEPVSQDAPASRAADSEA